jgi:6-phosphogluconolactonase
MDADMTAYGARVVVADDAADLARRAAQLVEQRAEDAAEGGRPFTLALSGGNTPRGLYERLASPPYRTNVPWGRTHIFFSDERFVPPTSPDSNYYLAEQTLLSRVDVPSRFVHAVSTVGMAPDESAALYQTDVERVFETAAAGVPQFDLILLGMGDDGHTASLFPGTEALGISDRLVTANFVPQKDMWRVTFTYPLINAAHCVMFLVAGADKADMVSRVLSGSDLPAAHVRPRGELIWVLDRAAAAELPSSMTAG